MRKKIALILMLGACQLISSGFSFHKKTKIYTPESNYKYQQKILRQEEIEKFKRSLLPESGLMTREEYEEKSRDIPNSERNVPEYKLPKDTKMKYIPQPTFKITHYNNPPGSAELKIGRNFHFDRQFVCPGITSPNKDFLVYPTVYYYATNQCTTCALYVIPLDKSLPAVSRIQRANIIKRNPEAILSTKKDIDEKFIFRTITPVDFSADGSKLLAKEKVGNINDGIWKTKAVIYDFNTKKTRDFPEIREAIKFYWLNNANLVLDEKRWDINPLGFDANDPERIIISAYGYTGNMPKFLGTWSIDCNGERSLLLSLFEEKAQVSMNGFKVVEDGIVNPAKVYNDEKRMDKVVKKKKKTEKKEQKKELKHKKQELKHKLKEMKKEEKTVLKEYRANKKTPSSPQD